MWATFRGRLGHGHFRVPADGVDLKTEGFLLKFTVHFLEPPTGEEFHKNKITIRTRQKQDEICTGLDGSHLKKFSMAPNQLSGKQLFRSALIIVDCVVWPGPEHDILDGRGDGLDVLFPLLQLQVSRRFTLSSSFPRGFPPSPSLCLFGRLRTRRWQRSLRMR